MVSMPLYLEQGCNRHNISVLTRTTINKRKSAKREQNSNEVISDNNKQFVVCYIIWKIIITVYELYQRI